MASLVALVGAGCKGEEALYARPATAFSSTGGGLGSGGGGSAGGAGMAGQGGSLGTGGVGSGGNKGSGGATGGAAGQGAGGAGGQQPTGMYGDSCQHDTDCKQGTCQNSFCCGVSCPGNCQTCNSTGDACTNVMSGLDPRNDCTASDPNTGDCSNDGTCNGNGMCKAWVAETPCSTVSTCKDTTSVISGSVCSGNGACQPNSPVSCNGFLCESNACLTTCTDGTACVTGGFCGAESCVGPTPNLAGNGDAEYGSGSTAGWSSINSNTGISTSAHSGKYSIAGTGRTANWNGPGYYIPTGLGRYDVSVWAMQNQVGGDPAPLIAGVLQLRLDCAGGVYYYLTGTVASMPMPQGTWVNFTGYFDSSMDANTGSDCAPGPHNGFNPGMVRNAIVFLEDNMNDPFVSMNHFVDFYMDDLVVTVSDGHNLVGNPDFEDSAKAVDGWNLNSVGSASLAVTNVYAYMGTQSLQENKRSLPGTGIRFALPIGAANYAVTIYATHSGAATHTLRLQAAYTCLGDPVTTPPTYRTKTIFQTGGSSGTPDPAAGTWVALSGTFAFPPVNAPANCQKMTDVNFWVTQGDGDSATNGCGTGTGQVECPDLFVDHATVTLTNTPPPP